MIRVLCTGVSERVRICKKRRSRTQRYNGRSYHDQSICHDDIFPKINYHRDAGNELFETKRDVDVRRVHYVPTILIYIIIL